MLPIELWQIIMDLSLPENQYNIKQLCKYIYDGVNFNDFYLNVISDKIEWHLGRHKITLTDIMKYFLKESVYSKTAINEIVDVLRKKKKCDIEKCKHHILKSGDEMNGAVCELCNIIYDCRECSYLMSSNYDMDDGDLFITHKCQTCSRSIYVYVCADCKKPLWDCKCDKDEKTY